MSIWVPIIPFLIGSIFCIEIAVHLGLTTKTEDEEIRKSRKNFGFAFTFFYCICSILFVIYIQKNFFIDVSNTLLVPLTFVVILLIYAVIYLLFKNLFRNTKIN